MFAELTTWIIETIRTHGALGVIIGVALEAIIVPIPSPVVVMAAGAILIEPGIPFMAALPTLLFVITIPAVITALIGSYIPYGIAYFGGRPLVEASEKYVGLGWEDVEKVRKKVLSGKRDEYSLFLFRALPIMPISLVSAAAGLIKMEWKRYSLATLLGLIPRIIVLSFLGWKLGELYMGLALRFESLETFISITLVLGILVLIVVHKFKLLARVEKFLIK